MSVQTGLAPYSAKKASRPSINVCTCGADKKRHPSNTSQWICERGALCPDGNGELKKQFSMMDEPPPKTKRVPLHDGKGPFGTSWERY